MKKVWKITTPITIVVAIVVIVLAIVFSSEKQPVAQVDVVAIAPVTVEADTAFEVLIAVDNPADHEQMLDSVSFENNFLASAEFVGASEEVLGERGDSEMHTYKFEIPLESKINTTFRMEFMSPSESQVIETPVDICIDGVKDCVRTFILVEVGQDFTV